MSDVEYEIVAYPTATKRELPGLIPARRLRDWQLATMNSFATQCLPLNIANNNGWELTLPGGFDVLYHGGDQLSAIEVFPHNDGPCVASSHFGYGVLTFFLHYLFVTSPDINLQIQGPVNEVRHGIQALSGILKTDWSPYTSTMNWKFTQPGRVRFLKGDSYAQISPIPARFVNRFSARIGHLQQERPEVYEDMMLWSQLRGDFLHKLRDKDPDTVKAGWQKLYYQGYYPDGIRKHCEHAIRLKPEQFAPPAKHADAEDVEIQNNYLADISCLVRVEQLDWRLFRTLDELSKRVAQIIVYFPADRIDERSIRAEVFYTNVEWLPVEPEMEFDLQIEAAARHQILMTVEPRNVLLSEFWDQLPEYQRQLAQDCDRILLHSYAYQYEHASRAMMESALASNISLLTPLDKPEVVLMNKSSLRSDQTSRDLTAPEKLIIN